MKELKTIREVMEAILGGKEVEFKNSLLAEWEDLKSVNIQIDLLDNDSKFRFRLKPTKPSIDWSHVSDEFKYLARDEDASAYLYGDKPTRGNSLWCSVSQDVICASAFKSLELGNCDWTESLVERPID